MKKLTIKNQTKTWWLSMASLVLVLGQQVGHLFGWEITSDEINQIMAIVNTLLVIAGSMGLITDTSKDSSSSISNELSTPTEVKTPVYQNSTNLRRN